MSFKQFYYKRNRLHQLKGFYYTAQLGSFSKAAKKMGLNQSTITLQIQSLERDLAVKVFERTKPLKLTSDGKTLYEMAFPLIHGIENFYEDFMARGVKHKESKINIATHHVAISNLLPKFIKSYIQKYPNIKVGIKNISQVEAIERLMSNEIDIAIYSNVESSDKYYSYCFAKYNPVLLMRNNHPLSKKHQIELEDIAKYDVVRIDKKLVALPIFEQVFKEFKFKNNIEFENGNWEIIRSFVKAGIGLGFVSTLFIDENDQDLTYKDLSRFFPSMDYSVMIKKGKSQSDAVKNFVWEIDKNHKFIKFL